MQAQSVQNPPLQDALSLLGRGYSWGHCGALQVRTKLTHLVDFAQFIQQIGLTSWRFSAARFTVTQEEVSDAKKLVAPGTGDEGSEHVAVIWWEAATAIAEDLISVLTTRPKLVCTLTFAILFRAGKKSAICAFALLEASAAHLAHPKIVGPLFFGFHFWRLHGSIFRFAFLVATSTKPLLIFLSLAVQFSSLLLGRLPPRFLLLPLLLLSSFPLTLFPGRNVYDPFFDAIQSFLAFVGDVRVFYIT